MTDMLEKGVHRCLDLLFATTSNGIQSSYVTITPILRWVLSLPYVKKVVSTGWIKCRQEQREWDAVVSDSRLLAVHSLIEIAWKGERAVSWFDTPVRLVDLYWGVKTAQDIVNGRKTYSSMGSKVIVINWIARIFTTTEQRNQPDPATPCTQVVVVFPDGSRWEVTLPEIVTVEYISKQCRNESPISLMLDWSIHQRIKVVVLVNGRDVPLTVELYRTVDESILQLQDLTGVGEAVLRLDGQHDDLPGWNPLSKFGLTDGSRLVLVETLSDEPIEINIHSMEGKTHCLTVSSNMSIRRLKRQIGHLAGIPNDMELYVLGEEDPLPDNVSLFTMGSPSSIFMCAKTSPLPTDGHTIPVRPLGKNTPLSQLPQQMWKGTLATVLHVEKRRAICSMSMCTCPAVPWFENGKWQGHPRLCECHHYDSD